MFRQTKVYAPTEGVIDIGINDKSLVMYLYDKDSKWPRKEVSLEEDAYIDEPGVILEVYELLKYLVNRDLACIPEFTFTLLSKESHHNTIRYDIGIGYLYPIGNAYLYTSKRKKSLYTKKLPLKLKGATIEEYHSQNATYRVRDINTGSTFDVPYHVVDISNYSDNPLLYFNPISLCNDKSISDFEWTELGDTGVKLYQEIYTIGSSVTLYLTDTTQRVYSTHVNYAAVLNMSTYKVETKLVQGLLLFSTQGDYLSHLDKIIKYTGGLLKQ